MGLSLSRAADQPPVSLRRVKVLQNCELNHDILITWALHLQRHLVDWR